MSWRGRVEMVIHVVDGVDMVGLLDMETVYIMCQEEKQDASSKISAR